MAFSSALALSSRAFARSRSISSVGRWFAAAVAAAEGAPRCPAADEEPASVSRRRAGRVGGTGGRRRAGERPVQHVDHVVLVAVEVRYLGCLALDL